MYSGLETQRAERNDRNLEREAPNMKRFLLCGVLLVLMAGCGTAGERPPEEAPEQPEPLTGKELTASAMEAYAEITKDLTFSLMWRRPMPRASVSPSPWRTPGTLRGGRTCSPTATSGRRPRRRPGGTVERHQRRMTALCHGRPGRGGHGVVRGPGNVPAGASGHLGLDDGDVGGGPGAHLKA